MALSASMVWEVRTAGADTNSGAFKAGATGTDYSNQDAAQFSGTDLVIDGTLNTKVTSASHNFVAADVGNTINISAGASWTQGIYEILSVASNAATLDRSPGATGLTGGTWAEGGALLTLAKLAANMVTSNKAFVKAGAGYSTTATITFGQTQAVVTNAVMPTRLIGYTTTRGDGGRATITLSTNTGLVALAISNGGWVIENVDINCASLGTSKGITLGGNPSMIRNVKVRNFTSRGIELNAVNQVLIDSEVTGGTSAATIAVLMNAAGIRVDRCYIHDNACVGIQGSGYIRECLIASNTGASSDGIFITGNNNGDIEHCTIYGSGRDAIRLAGRWWGGHIIQNNILANSTGYGMRNSDGAGTPAAPWWDGNAYYSNTLGTRLNMDDTATNPVNGIGAYTNVRDVILTSTPFVDAASADFRLNGVAGGGASCKQIGVPSSWPGNTPTAGYPDLGAAESGLAEFAFGFAG